MRSHECLYFLFWFETQSIKLFFLLVVYDTLTKRGEQAISDWTNLEFNSGTQVTWANQRLIFTFQWNLNKQRYNCGRMRDKDIEFIHIISIVTVVYSNGINLKILMSHWRYLTTTFKFPQASYIVSLDDIRIQISLISLYINSLVFKL